MNKNKLMDAMGYIDPALIEAADVQRSAKRGTIWKHPALIAACLCLVLAGTALAAELAGVHLSDFFDGHSTNEDGGEYDFLGYDFQATGLRRIPADSLAPKVLEHIAETRLSDGFYNIVETVYTKERAEQFLGIPLFDNPVLDGAELGAMGVYAGDTGDGSQLPERTTGTSGYVQMFGWGDAPEDIEVHLAYRFHSCEQTVEIENGWSTYYDFMPVYVTATLYTDATHSGEPEHHSEHHYVQNEYAEHTGAGRFSYTTPGGLEVTVAAINSTYSGEQEETICWYEAYFVMDGVLYEVEGGFEDGDLALDTIKEILDGFEYEATEQP